jgi:hypothetical protein
MSYNLFQIFKSIFSLILFSALLTLAIKPAFAATCLPLGDDPPSITEIVCPVIRIINTATIVSGAVFTIMVLYGGIKLALAMGDPKGFQAAKGTLTWALIGFSVVVFSVTILTLLVNTLDLNLQLNPFDALQTSIQDLLQLTKNPTQPL